MKDMRLLLSTSVGCEAHGYRMHRKQDETGSFAFKKLYLKGVEREWDGRVECACVWERRTMFRSLYWIGYTHDHNSEKESTVWP